MELHLLEKKHKHDEVVSRQESVHADAAREESALAPTDAKPEDNGHQRSECEPDQQPAERDFRGDMRDALQKEALEYEHTKEH